MEKKDIFTFKLNSTRKSWDLKTDTANSFPPDLDSATNTSGLSLETFLKLKSPNWRAKAILGVMDASLRRRLPGLIKAFHHVTSQLDCLTDSENLDPATKSSRGPGSSGLGEAPSKISVPPQLISLCLCTIILSSEYSNLDYKFRSSHRSARKKLLVLPTLNLRNVTLDHFPKLFYFPL